MKRNVLIAAIAATLFSATAWAQGGFFGPQGHGPGFGRGGGMMQGWGGGAGPGMGMGAGTCLESGAMAALGLTAEQREKIAAIQKEVSAKQVELAGSMRELRTEAFRSGERPAGANYEAMAALRRQMFELMQDSRERVAAVLTPEQRAQWRPGWRGVPYRG